MVFVLPTWTAQEVKKDDVKKDQDKTDLEKKDEKKKKDVEKKPAPEKLIFSKSFRAKILTLGANSTREFTVETFELDPKKQQEYANWVYTRQAQLAKQQFELGKQQFEIAKQKDPKAYQNAVIAYGKAKEAYQRTAIEFENEKVKKASGTNLMTVKPLELRAAENAKVRSLFPPVEFDELGNYKKWTKKELDERRDNTGLPGFAVDFDAIKSGQYVEVYLSRPAPMVKGKKKGPDDDDPPGTAKGQEFILIIIRQEAGK